jgi:hypothetical protein
MRGDDSWVATGTRGENAAADVITFKFGVAANDCIGTLCPAFIKIAVDGCCPSDGNTPAVCNWCLCMAALTISSAAFCNDISRWADIHLTSEDVVMPLNVFPTDCDGDFAWSCDDHGTPWPLNI